VHFTIDTIAPHITLTSPVNNLLTNKLEQTITGFLSEPATLMINGQVTAVAADNTFSFPVTLMEGGNSFHFSAQDRAGNLGDLTLRLNLDSIAPAIANVGLISVGNIAGSRLTICGAAESVEAGARVRLTNSRTGETIIVVAGNDGAFTADIEATAGDGIFVVVMDSAGNESAVASLRIASTLPPAAQSIPEGSFGYNYRDLIPGDASITQYNQKRFSLITGTVSDASGAPLPGVTIGIHAHPEYGTATTDATGRFTIPVEGGATLTLTYRRAGLIASHRQVYVPWNDLAIVETLRMIGEDQASTTLTFDGNPNTVTTHRSTEVSDTFGRRSCTLVFSGDNHAYAVDEEGNAIRELTTITTRATEFTTPESMPAKLPHNSGFTYCAELGVDGVERVRFEKPVIAWVENFLDFPIGEPVPVGYYDRDRGAWIPSDNGIVARLLDTTGEGIVDAIDINGDGQPDDLNENGSFADEAAGLDNVQKYPPGATFWRVAITHFTPWDCNWPCAPPDDATPPNPEGVPGVDQQTTEQNNCRFPVSSSVEERSRVFHEDIPIPGTGIALHYASNRVDGYKKSITIPASGASVPSSLKKIVVTVEVAGRYLEQNLEPLPYQKAVIEWDGLDSLGRRVTGGTMAHVSVGFVYNGVYQSPGNLAQAFAKAGRDVTRIQARREVISWMRHDLYLSAAITNAVADGWTLSIHHHLNPTDPSTLYKGDGTTTTGKSSIITTQAGSGPAGGFGGGGFGGDGGQATDARLNTPHGVAVDSAGNLYLADTWNACIRKVDANGIISTVAGKWSIWGGGYWGDGGPALRASLNMPRDLAFDAQDNLYFVDFMNMRIRKVNTNGIITTVAGRGMNAYDAGYSGDGGPATEADLNYPYGVAVDTEGNVYIADTYNHRIRKVDSNGIITTVAGNGIRGCNGDGGPATEATITYPSDVAVDTEGNVYILDSCQRIRKVDAKGIITTMAGGGQYSVNRGDGGPATQAWLASAASLTLDQMGNIYIADTWDARIRRVGTDGIITTVAGVGSRGYTGDEGPATQATIDLAFGIAVGPLGEFYIADSLNHRIRKVAPAASSIQTMSPGDIDIPFVEENGIGHIFSSTGDQKKTIDVDSGVILYSFRYDDANLLSAVTDRFGNEIVIERGPAGGVPTAIVSHTGIRTGLTIDAANHLTRITYPDGSHHDFDYTPDGLLTTKIEPKKNRFGHGFDPSGRLEEAFDEEGGSWRYSREVLQDGSVRTDVSSAEGNRRTYLDRTDSTGAFSSTITDETGGETLFSLSADGLTAHKTLPCGMDLTFSYGIDSRYKFEYVKEEARSTPSGLTKTTTREKTYLDTDNDLTPDKITEKETVNGKIATLLTDTLSSKKVLTSPEGRSATAFYDPEKLLTTRLAIPGLFDTTLGYDSRGRIASIQTGTRETTLFHDDQSHTLTVTDPMDQTTVYRYDSLGRMKGIDLPDSSTLSFSHDDNGNMTVLTNQTAIHHGFGYNKVNRNNSYSPPLSGQYTYIYDGDRRLKKILFPSEKTIENVYVNGRLQQVITPEGNIDFTHLCGTKVGSVAKGGEAVTYSYDGPLVTSETYSGTLDQALRNETHNNDFDVTRFTYAGSSVNYTYDLDGLLTGSGSYTITRHPGNGLPTSVSGGALALSRSFNGHAELEAETFGIAGQPAFSWAVTERDQAGRITRKTDTISGVSSDFIYTYDLLGRLRTVTRDGMLVEEYGYDPDGARTSEMNTRRGISRTLTYDEEDRIVSAGNTTYRFDPDGFLEAKTQGSSITRYSYSSRGELLSVTLPDGQEVKYLHDPLGRRIAKKINGVIVEKYLWQGRTRLLAVYDGSDSLLLRFAYADSRMPVSMDKDGAIYYLTYDQVGSLREVLDTAGTVVKRIDYDTFGNILSDTNPGFKIPFGFAGGLHDRDTNLVRFGYRDFDPETGRWSAKDPILFEGGDVDLYGYCLADPINWPDPLGLKTIVVTISDYGIGTHSALYIDNAGSPILYDPAGSYQSGSRGSGDAFSDQEANLDDYLRHHSEMSKVTIQPFDTSPCEEEAIANRIEEQGGVPPFFCAYATSSVISGIGPFKDLRIRFLPGSLSRALDAIQRGGR